MVSALLTTVQLRHPVIATPLMDPKSVLTLAALRGDGCSLELCYEPILSVNACHGDPVGWYEALLRLRTSTGELLRPHQFMPDDTLGNMWILAAIDFWVLEQVSALLHTTPATYSINFSRYMLADPLVNNRVKELVNGYGDRLVLEVSEKYHFSKDEIESMKSLRQIVRLTLDDFGVGRGEYLVMLPLSGVKIDGSLIENVVSDSKYQIFVRGIIAIANDLGLNCVCEYVSSPEIWNWLKEEAGQHPGIKLFVQGYAVGEYRDCQKTKTSTE